MDQDSKKGEYRIFGPPGTGKTHTLTRNIRRAAEKFGGENVLCASFTRAAAEELVSRVRGQELDVPPRAVGTIHSLCYRALGSPKLAEANIDGFNSACPPWARLTKASSASPGAMEDAPGDEAAGSSDADTLLAQYNLLRNKLVPEEVMPSSVRAFAKEWEGWKADADVMDFTDLLEIGAKTMLYAPNNAKVLFVDEAQDLTPLQFQLVRAWGKSVEFYILSGDDDQTLFQWSGASPEPLIDGNCPPERRIVLAQSYRVPAAVHRLASSWIGRVSRREPKEYKPRDHEGAVTLSSATFRDISPLYGKIVETLEDGKTFMFLAATSYMLRGAVIKTLKEWGIPFHNPFRRTQGEWNPLRPSKVNRMLDYLKPMGPEYGGFKLWTPQQLQSWTEVCAVSGLLKRGGKKKIASFCQIEDWSTDQLLDLYEAVFEPQALDEAVCLKPHWFQGRLTADRVDSYGFLSDICEKRGHDVLTKRPGVLVGTIHSVKGGEADVVALFPDISPVSHRALAGVDGVSPAEARDAIIRQFYVGMTRAREELVVCEPATRFNVRAVG
jgi:superfamily I DNA/RNA helicase